MLKKLREFENVHILLWLVKDTCWISDLKIAGMVMVVPTVLAAILITWGWRKDASEFLHSLAVTLWIVANSIWMTGEFFYDDTLRPYAFPFFIAGLLTVSVYYVYLLPKRKAQERKQAANSNKV